MSTNSETVVVLDDGEARSIRGNAAGDRLLVERSDLEETLGWTLKPEGFCRGERCVPLPGDGSVVTDSGVDLVAWVNLVNRPAAVDVDERAAYLGHPLEAHARTWETGKAPDFTLPDLRGDEHALSDYRGQKVFLVAHASW